MISPSELFPKFIRTKYSRRLLVLLSIIVLVIGAIGGFAYVQTGKALQENTEMNLEQTAKLQAHAVEEWIQGTENHVETLSTTEEIRSDNSTRVEQRLRDEQESMSDSVIALHRVDSEFEIRASSVDVAGTNLQAEGVEWAQDDVVPDDGETVRFGPYSDPIADGQNLAIVSAIPDSDGYLVAVIDLESQTEALENRFETDDTFSLILDSEATVVMGHHTEKIGEPDRGHDDKHLEIVNRALEGESGYVRMKMSGHGHDDHDSGGVNAHHGDLAMGYAPVEDTGWVLMIHAPADRAFALQDQIGQMVLALLGVSLIGLGAIGLIVGRNTSRSLTQLATKAREIEEGNLDTELHSSREDELGQLYDAFANMRDSLRQSFHETETARAEAEQQRQQLEELARQLEEEAGEVMARAADGDLTGRIEVDNDSHSIEQVASEYNDMINEIEQTASQLKQFATTVAAHSEEVTASAEEVQSSSETVSRSVQTISAQTTKQDEKLQVVSANVSEISTTTEEIASLSQEVSTIAERTARAGEQGRDAAQQAINSMDVVDRESRETVAVIERFQEEIAQVEEIAGIIADIAGQMNMLALNANIEAARSGTADDGGFGAVAEEVKKLSSESQESAEKIEEMADEILSRTERVTDEVQDTRKEITATQEKVERAANAYESVVDYAERTSEGVSEISAATQQQAASTQEIVAMVDETAELSSDVANEAGEVAAAAEEQTSALSEVTKNAERLAGEATDLEEGLDRFEVSSNIEDSDSVGLTEKGRTNSETESTERYPLEGNVKTKDSDQGRHPAEKNEDASFEFDG